MITFNQLRQANANRMQEIANKDGLNTPFSATTNTSEDWNILEWCGAMCGEAGEAANVAKKMRRGQDMDINDLAEELADTVIYADLAAKKMGIDLGEAIMNKFNEKSMKWKCETRIETPEEVLTDNS